MSDSGYAPSDKSENSQRVQTLWNTRAQHVNVHVSTTETVPSTTFSGERNSIYGANTYLDTTISTICTNKHFNMHNSVTSSANVHVNNKNIINNSDYQHKAHSPNVSINSTFLDKRGPPPSYEYHIRKHAPPYLKPSQDSPRSSGSSASSGQSLSTSTGVQEQNSSTTSLPVGYGGWNPSRSQSSVRTDKEEDQRKMAQIAAYTQWVNIQLKRRPGSRPIEDLKCDMQDGVSLAHLIEIVAGEELEGIHDAPSTQQQMEANVDKAIQFMMQRRIRMHTTTAKDIVSGNIKSIMRLILALAAHFKPNSVKQSHQGSPSKAQQTVAGIAQGAAAALAEIKRDALRTSQRPRRPKHLQQKRGSGTGSDSDAAAAHSASLERHGDGAAAASPLTTGGSTSPRPHTLGGGSHHSTRGGAVTKSRSQDFPSGYVNQRNQHLRTDDDCSDVSQLEVTTEVFSSLQEDHQYMEEDLVHTKQALLKLQDLLLNGRLPDGEEDPSSAVAASEAPSSPAEAQTAEEEVVILRSRLQQSDEVTRELRHDLSKVKHECMQLQGAKAGLQQRQQEQEQVMLMMKAELLRAGFAQQSVDNAKAELECKQAEKDRMILDLRRELAKREREIDEMKSHHEIECQQRENVAASLRVQITDLHERLRRVGETEATLSARVASQDRKMARLEGRIMQTVADNRPMSSRSTHSATSNEDFQLVRDSLQCLRTRFQGNDPQRHTVDQLEKSISSLMDRLHTEQEQEPPVRRNYDSTGSDSRRSPISAGFSSHRLDAAGGGQTPSSTKVLYFTDHTVAPFMCTLPKRLGEITLADIKQLVDRPGNFRYHFKAMDPEFGTVKEEISHDDDIVPGWEGKIVAWIEKSPG